MIEKKDEKVIYDFEVGSDLAQKLKIFEWKIK